jgi:hypothetical protein
MFLDLETRHSKETKMVRKKWCKCVTEFGEMISEEVKTNERYKYLKNR